MTARRGSAVDFRGVTNTSRRMVACRRADHQPPPGTVLVAAVDHPDAGVRDEVEIGGGLRQ